MQYCKKCHVHVRGMQKKCPLCQGPLAGEPETQDCYPRGGRLYKESQLFFKIFLFATVVAGVLASAVNLLMPNTGHWAFFVDLAIVGLWISIYLAVHRKNSLPQHITMQAVFVSAFSVVWDAVTHWHGWSISYVIPAVFVITMISMTIIAWIMNIPASEYLICLIIDIVFGFVPIIFYVLDLLIMEFPAVICISSSVICLTGILIFQGAEIKQELIRRFHL